MPSIGSTCRFGIITNSLQSESSSFEFRNHSACAEHREQSAILRGTLIIRKLACQVFEFIARFQLAKNFVRLLNRFRRIISTCIRRNLHHDVCNLHFALCRTGIRYFDDVVTETRTHRSREFSRLRSKRCRLKGIHHLHRAEVAKITTIVFRGRIIRIFPCRTCEVGALHQFAANFHRFVICFDSIFWQSILIAFDQDMTCTQIRFHTVVCFLE